MFPKHDGHELCNRNELRMKSKKCANYYYSPKPNHKGETNIILRHESSARWAIAIMHDLNTTSSVIGD